MTEKKLILLVEDEKDMSYAVTLQLEVKGYEVITAYDGQEGLEKARAKKPDLIILDLMLSKMDGYKVCRMLKFDSAYKDIPIIIVSARDSDKDRELGRNCGADLYVTKPVDL